jgi:NhaP-type Na+/H+ or K+/H+ antiporter
MVDGSIYSCLLCAIKARVLGCIFAFWIEKERPTQNLKSYKSRLFQGFVGIVGVKR